MILVTKSPKETEKLAGFLLKKIKDPAKDKASVIALEGELGAGKTVLTRGLAKMLGIQSKIKSPTFTLMRSYKIKDRDFKYLYHLDCYRLRDHKDLDALGFKEIINDSENIVLIEWSDRVKKILPKNYLKVHIDHISETERKITIE